MHTLLTAATTPLPDFIASNDQLFVLASIGSMVGAIVGLGLIVWAFVSKTPRISVLLLGLVITVGTIGLVTTDEIKPAHRTALAVAAVEDAYGVTIPASAAYDLRYPGAAPEDSVPEQFGAATIEAGGQWRKVALVWNGEQMLLAELDLAGLPYVEFEPVR